MSQTTSRQSVGARSPWAAGASAFAATLLVVAGALELVQGLVAVIDGSDFFGSSPDYPFGYDPSTWGWVHLVLGLLLAATGIAIFRGSWIGRAVGITLAGLSVVLNFLWLPYYPEWALVLIAVGILVVWGLSVADLSRR